MNKLHLPPPDFIPEKGEKVAPREIYGKTLVELGKENLDIVVLDADLSGSTKTGIFANEFPKRFFNAGIAEQNMVGMAAGLAACGKIPFASTFAIFAAGRAYEQIRNSVAYPDLNVKIVATHAGVDVGEDGGSHQAIEDIGLMRGIPNMNVLVPADAVELHQMLRYAAKTPGPFYIRMGRSAVPTIFDKNYEFTGKAETVYRPEEELSRKVALLAIGSMVAESIKAAEILRKQDIGATVLNCSSIKPLDKEAIIAAARENDAIVTAEEHSVTNGLGSAVAEVLGENFPVPMEFVGVQDKFGQSGKSSDLMKHYGLTPENIAAAGLKAVARAAQLIQHK